MRARMSQFVAAVTVAVVAASCHTDTPATPVVVPVVTTAAVSAVTRTSAVSGGDISFDGGAEVTARGVCWGTDSLPTTAGSRSADGAGTGQFTSHLTGLTAETTYHVRAWATNSAGTGYGESVRFVTQLEDSSTVTDVDGNVYPTLRIGGKLWMVQNLKVTRYNNGEPIPNVVDDAEWVTLDTPAYCWYWGNYDIYGTVYGALYNWYAVDSLSNGNRNIAPAGWHIPAEAEWTALTDALGGLGVAGGKMKEAGTTHWLAPNTGANNSSGFTGLPGGYRGYVGGGCAYLRNFGHWWSRTSADEALAWGEGLFYLDNPANHSTSNKKNGFSIRCVKG